MATFQHVNSRRMYSWWWDSHISPKNSKWLQENLTDMDAKVKSMIKLIEEDADSFARRAEMYYKKRPELMKMVEEFYRAYRALAERYDHATGVIRHAHRTMAEAFPNQVPPMLDDAPSSGTESQTADMSTPARAIFEPDEQQNESPGHSVSHSNDAKRNNTKFNDGKVKKSLNFHESVVKERSRGDDNHTQQKQADELRESEEILALKKALAELQAEKEAGLSQYQQSLEKLSVLESEISRVQEDSKGLAEKASQAEAEAQSLKETLAKLEDEKNSSLLQYRQCLQKISELEDSVSHAEKDAQELNQRASKAKLEAQSVKDELAKVTTEKDAALDQYMSSLEMISNLEHKLKCAEEDAKMFKERAEKAENEVEILKQAISKLTEEKEAAELKHHQGLETISGLESNLSLAQEEAQQLKTEIEKGITDLKGAEEQCLLLERTNRSLHSELEVLILKTGSQSQELTEKQKELGRLWTCIQEERLRFVEAETAFQTLQHLHAQAQDELRSLALELQNKVQTLAETETHRKNLQEEVLKVKEENKNLNEVSVSSAITIKDLQTEISSLTDTKGKLEEEVELRVDQRNALQQEIYCMKEELNDLKRKNSSIMEQVLAAGLDAETFGSSVRVLQDENLKLKEARQREISEKSALLERLQILEHLLEKNSLLETSLSDLNAELEAVRGKIQSLEESCQSLVEEKSSLLDEKASLQTQLLAANENLGELTEKNTSLENFLCQAHDELEVLKKKSISLEESCELLAKEKGRAAAENDVLSSQLQSTQTRLENLEKRYAEMGERYSALEKEKELSVGKIQELQISLDLQKQEHASFVQVKELQLACMKNEVQLLQEEIECTKRELEKGLDGAFESQTEVFILRRCAGDLQDKNLSLSTKNQKLLEKLISLEGMLANLKQDNLNQKVEIMSLSDEGSTLRKGITKLLKALDIVLDHGYEGRSDQDQIHLNHVLSKLEDIKDSFFKSDEETLLQSVELSILLTMLGHLRFQFENLELEKRSIEQESIIKSEQLSASQNEVLLLHEMNEEMKSKVIEGEQKQEGLTTQISDLQKKLMDLQSSYQDLQRENIKILEEKGSLTKGFLQLEENTHVLEGENSSLCSEILSLDCLSTLLRNCVSEKSVELTKLIGDLDNLNGVNDEMRQRLIEGEQRQEALTTQVSDLQKMLMDMQMSYRDLQRENIQVVEEKGSLTKEFLQLEENNRVLEGENSSLCSEILSLDCLSIFLTNCIGDKSVELTKLIGELDSLNGVNDDMRQRLMEGVQKQEALMTQVSDLEKNLMDMQRSYQDLQRENIEVVEEKGSLTKGFLQLEENTHVLEGENSSLCSEILSLDCLSTLLRNCVGEKSVELTKLIGELDNLNGVNDEMRQRLIEGEQRQEALTTQVSDSQKMLMDIQMSYRDLQKENIQVVEEKGSLTKEFLQLQDNNHVLEGENSSLCSEILSLDCLSIFLTNCLGDKSVELTKLIGRVDDLNGINDDMRQSLSATERKLEELLALKELELQKLREEHQQAKIKEESLYSELQMAKNEVEMWEAHSSDAFVELHVSNLFQVLYDEKIHELTRACDVLKDDNATKDTDIMLLRERASTLASENEGLNVELTAYIPAIASLEAHVSSLEEHTCLLRHVEVPETANGKVHGNSSNHDELVFDPISHLQDLQMRIQSIEKAVTSKEQLLVQENQSVQSELEAAMRQVAELKSEHSQRRRNSKPTSEVFEVDNGLLTKDIMLDQVSEFSPYRRSSRREQVDRDSRNLESWETIDQDGSIDLTVSKTGKMVVNPSADRIASSHRVKSGRKQKSELPTAEILVEKELGVDKLELSKRYTEPLQEGSKRKVLERLNSDVQKLTNLQITVQDLKRKLDIIEKSKKGKSVDECDILKEQLEEANAAILKLFDLNGKLAKNVDDNTPLSSHAKSSSMDSDESGSVRKRKIAEQARRMSERIGRLQLEVQKIQFVLLKLDDEKDGKGKGKSKLSEAKRRVLLRDYLYGYGVVRSSGNRRKKGPFCGCVQPRTEGD